MDKRGKIFIFLFVIIVVVVGILLVVNLTKVGIEISTITADDVKKNNLLLIERVSTSSIFTTHVSGIDEIQVTTDAMTPSWTPDGEIIFVSSRSGSRQIWIINADGGNARQIGNLPLDMKPLTPQMAENGMIIFMGNDENSEPDNNVGIWLMRKDGTGLEKLTRGMQPYIARSGKWIAFTLQTDIPYHRQIWRINTDGSNLQQLTFLGDPDYPDANAPSISPDESMIAFFSGKESDRGAASFGQSPLTYGHRNIAVIPSTGGVRKTLTPCRPVTTQVELDTTTDCIAADNPSWTPDGKWLIFDTGFKSGSETWMVDLNGLNFQRFYPKTSGVVRVPLKSLLFYKAGQSAGYWGSRIWWIN